eukprot:160020-Prymnesium_polylepis.1
MSLVRAICVSRNTLRAHFGLRVYRTTEQLLAGSDVGGSGYAWRPISPSRLGCLVQSWLADTRQRPPARTPKSAKDGSMLDASRVTNLVSFALELRPAQRAESV